MTVIDREQNIQNHRLSHLKTWISADAYAKRILLGSANANPWQSVAGYVTWFGQAQNLIQSDLGIISIGEVFDLHAAAAGGLAQLLGQRKSPKMAMRRLLQSEAARGLINEVLSAVLAQTSQLILLRIPSPRAWLNHAVRLAGLNVQEIVDEDIEDAAAYVTDVIRALSTQPIAGLIIEEDAAAEAVAAWSAKTTLYYRPLINIAQHYRWSIILHMPQQQSIEAQLLDNFDAVISKIQSQFKTDSALLGLELSDEFNQAQTLPTCSAHEFYYIELAEDSRPEISTQRIAALKKQIAASRIEQFN